MGKSSSRKLRRVLYYIFYIWDPPKNLFKNYTSVDPKYKMEGFQKGIRMLQKMRNTPGQ